MTEAIHLVDLNDQTTGLDELLSKDKMNLLLFYNTNCLGCTGRAIPFGYDLSKSYSFINLIIIHVSFGQRKETVDEINEVYTDKKAPFPIYRDLNNTLYKKMSCEGTPHWIFIDGGGKVTHSVFGSQDGAKLKINFAIDEIKSKFS